MNLIIWLVVGGVIGWIASMIMRTDAQQGVLLNVVVGIVGAMLGGWLISPLLGVGTINQDNFSIGAMVVSLVGAVILLAIVNLFRRGSVR
ncbi:MAG: GlsB/YeaQ/YmgE family stress response membrane protein [Burkholderiales bacterium]|nr:MAG: GlsB/YeaQ/YmgE family stress response membrane protein [Burkholderiales bacterium]